MGFPDRIERTIEVAHPPAKVWAALTTAEGLSAWFGQEATIDLRPGGAASMKFDGGQTAEMRVERVEEPTVFGYTWHVYGLPEDDPRRTYVEFTLEPRQAAERLVVRVLDEGDGFDAGAVADPLAAENILKASGRGIFFMRSFMDDVTLRRASEGGMEVRMVKKLAPGD